MVCKLVDGEVSPLRHDLNPLLRSQEHSGTLRGTLKPLAYPCLWTGRLFFQNMVKALLTSQLPDVPFP